MPVKLVVQDVRGLKELDDFLRQFPDDMQRSILYGSLMAAAEPIMKQARLNVARNFGMSMRYTGTLYHGLVRGRRKRTGLAARVDVKLRRPGGGRGRWQIKTGPTGNRVWKKYGDDPFYGRFLEFGTRNMPARPFLRPAADMMQGQAGARFKLITSKRVDAYARKHGYTFRR